MEKVLTPLLKSLIYIGSALQKCSTDEALHQLNYALSEHLPNGCYVDIDDLEVYLQDIKDEGRLSIVDIVEFQKAYFVKLNNGLRLIYDADKSYE